MPGPEGTLDGREEPRQAYPAGQIVSGRDDSGTIRHGQTATLLRFPPRIDQLLPGQSALWLRPPALTGALPIIVGNDSPVNPPVSGPLQYISPCNPPHHSEWLLPTREVLSFSRGASASTTVAGGRRRRRHALDGQTVGRVLLSTRRRRRGGRYTRQEAPRYAGPKPYQEPPRPQAVPASAPEKRLRAPN